jgi:hypothetical protein
MSEPIATTTFVLALEVRALMASPSSLVKGTKGTGLPCRYRHAKPDVKLVS